MNRLWASCTTAFAPTSGVGIHFATRYVQTCRTEVKAQTACRGNWKWQIAFFPVICIHGRVRVKWEFPIKRWEWPCVSTWHTTDCLVCSDLVLVVVDRVLVKSDHIDSDYPQGGSCSEVLGWCKVWGWQCNNTSLLSHPYFSCLKGTKIV